jgi:hypothetical protein
VNDVLPPTLHYDDAPEGAELPTWTFEVSPTLIVIGAICSRNFRDVHHATDRARLRGSRDIFMSSTTTTGYVARYLTDWAGPEAMVRSISLRLGVPTYPYDTLSFSGRVTATQIRENLGELTIEVTAANSLGNHAEARGVLALPLGASAR